MKRTDALTQIIIVGIAAFCCPGIFNAMNGLGGVGGGTEGAKAASAANLPLYAMFALFGYFGGAFFNLFGNRVLMTVGGLTYAAYAICMFFAQRHALTYLAVIGGLILGFGAGWFWTAQGAMMMAYATPNTKGKYIAIFWAIFNLGAMIGGLLSFGLNFNSDAGESSPATYFTFCGLMAFGSLISFMLLAKPSSVVREDGQTCKFEEALGWKEEIKGALSVATNKYMLFLVIPFLASNWFYTYQFNGYNLQNFNVRTRGFNSAFYWGSQMLGAWCIGKLLDKKDWTLRKRGLVGLAVVAIEFNLAHLLGAIVQHVYGSGFERNQPIFQDTHPVTLDKDGNLKTNPLDFLDSARYVFPFFVYILYGLGDAMIQSFAYWVMAGIANDNTNLLTRFAGFYKGIQSIGAAAAWGIDFGEVKYVPQFWICWGFVVAGMIMFYLVARDLKDSVPALTANKSAQLEKALSLGSRGLAPQLAPQDYSDQIPGTSPVAAPAADLEAPEAKAADPEVPAAAPVVEEIKL